MTELMKRYRGGVFKMNDFEKNMYQEIRMLREKFSILKLENAKLKEQLRWRPVSEKPEEDGFYLVTDGGYYDTQKYCNGKWNIWSDRVGDWVIDDGDTKHFHWLPIPPAQKGE